MARHPPAPQTRRADDGVTYDGSDEQDQVCDRDHWIAGRTGPGGYRRLRSNQSTTGVSEQGWSYDGASDAGRSWRDDAGHDDERRNAAEDDRHDGQLQSHDGVLG